MRFSRLLEKEFREHYTEQNLPRARLSMAIPLVLLWAVAGLEVTVGLSPLGSLVDRRWLAILVPLMTAVLIAMYLPSAARRYTWIAAVGVTVVGFATTFLCHTAALNGASYVLAAEALVVLYACLFLGLLFYVAVAVGTMLVAAHVGIGLAVGLPAEPMWYTTAILGAAAVAATISAYKQEHAVRTNFLETRVLHELAERDGMTGLYNRRIFDDYAKRIWRQSRREGERLEIVLVDIDYFKVYNDLYGHQAGDDTLRRVADTIARGAKRPFDFTARYGGEEFVLILYGPPEEYARALPEQIRRDVMDLAIAHEGSPVASVVTVSVGVALADERSGRSLAGAIQVADEALYQAKQEGRNRVVYKTTDDDEVQTGNFRVPRRRLA
ncbi:MAG: GGDEF domain-containing protein [Gammaproteobacteria bacterium]|nr:GGDEF domain-containing protein [Gammaproteobacteria bacterium]